MNKDYSPGLAVLGMSVVAVEEFSMSVHDHWHYAFVATVAGVGRDQTFCFYYSDQVQNAPALVSRLVNLCSQRLAYAIVRFFDVRQTTVLASQQSLPAPWLLSHYYEEAFRRDC